MPLPRPLHPGQMLPNSCTTMKSHGSLSPQGGYSVTPFYTSSWFFPLCLSLCAERSSWPPYLSEATPESPVLLVSGSGEWELKGKRRFLTDPASARSISYSLAGGRVSNNDKIQCFSHTGKESSYHPGSWCLVRALTIVSISHWLLLMLCQAAPSKE